MTNHRVTFEAYDVMWLHIKGKVRPEAKASKLPMTRDDGDLINEMYDFMKQEKIRPVRTMSTGGGCYDGLFNTPDGEKILKWLKEHDGLDVSKYQEEKAD